jgi:hypothetical protein
MSAKDNAAVNSLFDLLESRYAMRVLWALKDGHPQTFRLLQDSVGLEHPPQRIARCKPCWPRRLWLQPHQRRHGFAQAHERFERLRHEMDDFQSEEKVMC